MKDWVEVLPHPSVALISGRRGAGKSGLGYFLLETLSRGQGVPAYTMGLPREKWGLLPDSILPIELGRELPESAIIFVDEAGMGFYARESQRELNKVMNVLLSISRQRDETILFATHVLRKLDVGIVMDADAILMKEPSKLHASFERSEIQELTKRAWQLFDGVKDPVEKKRRVVVFSHDLYGEVMDNPLPPFWSEALSKAFAAVPLESKHDTLKPNERKALEGILELHEGGRVDKRFGWEIKDVPELSGGLIVKFLSQGLIQRGYTSASTKCFFGNLDRIHEVLRK